MRISQERFDGILISLLCLCSAGLFLFLAFPTFQGKIYVYDDLGFTHFPFRYFYAQALAAGDNFLWNPKLYCGFYFQGEGQAGMMHPLHWLLYRGLPLTWAFNLEFLASYPVLFAGMYWMLRRWDLQRPAALLGALSFTFGGFNLMHFMHMNAIAIVAHIPWLIVLADALLSAGTPQQFAAAQMGIALFTGSQWLLGYPQYVLLSTVAEFSFVVWKTLQTGQWRPLRWWVAAKVTGSMIGMVQVLPTWESLKASVRHDPSLDFRLSHSLHPVNFLQLWCPFVLRGHVYGDNAHELALYSGGFCTVALFWTLIRGTHRNRRWKLLTSAAAVFAIVTLIFATGRYGLIYAWIARLPLIGLFRNPARYIVLAHWAMSILAAVTFNDLAALSRQGQRVPWKALWPLALPAALSLVTTAAAAGALSNRAPTGWPVFLQGNIYSSIPRAASGTLLLLAAVVLTALAARGFRWSLAGIVLLITVDVLGWGMDYVRGSSSRSLSPTFMTTNEFLKSIPEPPDALLGRIDFMHDPMWTNVLTIKGYSLTEGYVALSPSRILDVHSDIYRRLADARWTTMHGHWERIANPVERVRMVTRSVPAPTAQAELNRVDIAHIAWTNPAVELDGHKPGSADIVADRPGRIDIHVLSPSRQLLVLSESYHPGWQATQDDKPIPVLRAYGDFTACLVDPGSHRIALRFRPSSFVWGIRITMAGLLILGCSSLWLLRCR